MATIPQQFSDSFENNIFGIVTGSVSMVQFATGTVCLIRFKAHPNNIGLFVLGNGVQQTYWLDAGDDTGWCSLLNPNQLWYSDISGSVDYLAYWMQR